MVLIVWPDTEYTMISISNNTCSFIKDSVILWEINHRYEEGCAIGNSNYIYVMFDMLAHFRK